MPELQVVALEQILPHEETDPLRVETLLRRLEMEQIQANPMVCFQAPGGELILLDGATRTEALRRLGLKHAVVQLVDPAQVTLETWHHVVRACPPAELLSALRERDDLTLVGDEGPPLVRLAMEAHTVFGEGVSPNATLVALAGTYLGHWSVARVTDPHPDTVAARFPDWSAIVEFPILTRHDVVKAAIGQDLLPAGVTRFLVPGRALGLDLDLSLLMRGSREEMQAAVEDLLQRRAQEGRIRRYEEPVVVLDD